jgi:hypothetical protein
MICGGVQEILTDIERPDTTKLDEFIKYLPQDEAVPMVAFSGRLHQKLATRLGMKMQYVFDPPVAFLGAVGHIAGYWDKQASKRLVQKCLSFRDKAIADGKGDALDCVTVRFSMDSAQPWKASFEAFASDPQADLCEETVALCFDYLGGKVHTRKTEGIHGHILSWKQKKVWAVPGLLNLLLKGPEIERSLMNADVWQFCVLSWRKRELPRTQAIP